MRREWKGGTRTQIEAGDMYVEGEKVEDGARGKADGWY
jgi:hypothetical protein